VSNAAPDPLPHPAAVDVRQPVNVDLNASAAARSTLTSICRVNVDIGRTRQALSL
jgi:hypothetical protein